jgi:hypothetical protein
MSLIASESEPGLWVNSDASIGGAGVHALLIGVSRYDHLADGKSPAPDTYGLGQLSASAHTAYRFFLWLRDQYVLSGLPVARVRLLMSPIQKGVGKATEDELAGCDVNVCAHAPEATFANCQAALERWYADMEGLKSAAIGRSLFLFSGHGMERRQNFQVLLPSDYLRPPGQLVNNAISTPNISDALSYLPRVASHVLLLDGCRNDVDKLRGTTGAKILNDDQATPINPLFEKGVLYATASGLRSYSPKAGGLSLFGQALLDGLRNQPEPKLDEAPMELTKRGSVPAVEINRLASYMKGRVAALIKAARENVIQVVRSEVASSNPGMPIMLTELPTTPPLIVGYASFDTTRSPRRGLTPQKPSAVWLNERYQQDRVAVLPPPDASRGDQINGFHAVFGSEAVTYPWLDTLSVVGISSGDSFDHRSVEILSSAQALRISSLHRVRILFRVTPQDRVGHVMVIEDGAGQRFSCVLPTDVDRRTFQLEIDIDGSSIINFAAFLSPENEAPAGLIATAWEQLRANDPLSAAAGLMSNGTEGLLNDAFSDGEFALREKLRSPLAATVAAVLLLKGNQFERMHDWARNLANWFPDMPDGVVIWTEQCRRMARGKPLDPQLLTWFVRELSKRSLPFTSDGFDIASDLLRNIVRGRLRSDDATRRAARRIAYRLDLVSPYFQDTGFFCGYRNLPKARPHLRLGPTRRPFAARYAETNRT